MATQTDREQLSGVKDDYRYGFHDEASSVYQTPRGLDHSVIDAISDQKNEPDWMRQFRHEALDIFLSKPMPTWGADLNGIDFNEIIYYLRPMDMNAEGNKSWDDVPDSIKRTFDRLGIPEAERKFLAGVGAQYDSEVVYHSLREDLALQTAPLGGPVAPGTPLALLSIPSSGRVDQVVVEGTASGDLMNGPGHKRDTVLALMHAGELGQAPQGRQA